MTDQAGVALGELLAEIAGLKEVRDQLSDALSVTNAQRKAAEARATSAEAGYAKATDLLAEQQTALEATRADLRRVCRELASAEAALTPLRAFAQAVLGRVDDYQTDELAAVVYAAALEHKLIVEDATDNGIWYRTDLLLTGEAPTPQIKEQD